MRADRRRANKLPAVKSKYIKKPAALMLRITNDNFDEVIQDIKQAKATAAINLKRKQQAEKETVTEKEKR